MNSFITLLQNGIEGMVQMTDVLAYSEPIFAGWARYGHFLP
jgi:hypothetical protein